MSNDKHNDISLIKACSNGDHNAFNKIYNKTSNPKLKKLAKEIIDTQEKEIQLMKSML